MHPYRQTPPARADAARPLEELVLYGALVVIGGLRVLLAVAMCSFGAEATIALLMVAAGLIGLTASVASRA